MKNKYFIIYNIVIFIIFLSIIVNSLDGIHGLLESKELILFSFGLTGILIQSYVINKKLSE